MKTKKKFCWERKLPRPIVNYFWLRLMQGDFYLINRLECLVINHVALNGGDEAGLMNRAQQVAEQVLGLNPRN